MIRPIILVVGFIAVMAIFFAIAYKKNLLDTRPSSVIPNLIIGILIFSIVFYFTNHNYILSNQRLALNHANRGKLLLLKKNYQAAESEFDYACYLDKDKTEYRQNLKETKLLIEKTVK